jgi:flagellar biosynthesis/type III secretory pathway M-ring protein FliF/YscJ
LPANGHQVKKSEETEDTEDTEDEGEEDESASDSEDIDTTGLSTIQCMTEDSPELQALLLRK